MLKSRRLEPEQCVFFECDVQKNIITKIQNHEALVQNCARLAKAASIFEIPLIATRQANFGSIVK